MRCHRFSTSFDVCSVVERGTDSVLSVSHSSTRRLRYDYLLRKLSFADQRSFNSDNYSHRLYLVVIAWHLDKSNED